MPDFIDFDAQMAATGDDERKLLEAAMSRAEAAQEKAQHGLVQSSQAAQEQHTGLSQTGSYSDYLQAKRNAANAWAEVSGSDANPRSMRNVLARGGQGRAAGEELATREAEFGQRNEGNAASHAASVRAASERAEADARARSERETSARDATNKHLQSVYGRWMLSHQLGGGTEDRQRYAQMLSTGVDEGWALPGLTAEQRSSFGSNGDRRGWGIESDAWGTRAKSTGRATTKKGTAY